MIKETGKICENESLQKRTNKFLLTKFIKGFIQKFLYPFYKCTI